MVRQFTNRVGNRVWVHSHLTAMRDQKQQNRLIGYMDVCYDITRSVEGEQALRESEARYRAIVEDYQTELICRFKPNGTLTFVNEVYCRYFGKEREQLLGMNFLYFIPESERPKLIQHLVSFGQEKNVATLEHQVALPALGVRWFHRTDRAIFDARGRIFEFQSVGRDITDRKKMEAQIQAAQAHLIQAARMATIGEVASGVAHQIYNPLTTIIADAQILLRSLSADQPGRDSAEAIEQAGWRLQQVIQRLMEFSRPASEALEPVSITQTIQAAVSLVYANLEAAGCRLQVELGEDLPAVQGNQRQLEALWVNLLLLARDASDDGRAHTVHITSRRSPPNVAIVEICDDGRPIPADQLPAVFEPNFIGPKSGRGTGIELSICREIVRQHGGHIIAESAPERKTIFRVTLPGGV
jgi:PAS domain S-box-containing protein